MCCGERMTPKSPALSGNPNICASCVSLLDEMDDWDAPGPGDPAQVQRETAGGMEAGAYQDSTQASATQSSVPKAGWGPG
jgi:hypothetical protein